MSGVLLLYTGAFLLYGVMEVLGLMPQELVSAGLTLPRLFAKYLGNPVSACDSCYSMHILTGDSGCFRFVGSGFHDIPSETNHDHNLCASHLAADLLHRNVHGRTTGLSSKCTFLTICF